MLGFNRRKSGDRLLASAVGMFDRASKRLDVATELFDAEHQKNSEAQKELEARRSAIEAARDKAQRLADRFREFVN